MEVDYHHLYPMFVQDAEQELVVQTRGMIGELGYATFLTMKQRAGHAELVLSIDQARTLDTHSMTHASGLQQQCDLVVIRRLMHHETQECLRMLLQTQQQKQ